MQKKRNIHHITTTYSLEAHRKIIIYSCDVMCDAYLMYEAHRVYRYGFTIYAISQMAMHVCLPEFFFESWMLLCAWLIYKKSRGFRHCLCIYVAICVWMCLYDVNRSLSKLFAQYYCASSPKFRIWKRMRNKDQQQINTDQAVDFNRIKMVWWCVYVRESWWNE